jgi:ribonucleoside-diphosphate reductase beta chain
MFFGESVNVQRFDIVKYQHIESLNRQQIGFFWVPEEFDLNKDNLDFHKELDQPAQFIFTSNLLRQIMLDSIQGRGPALCLLPIVSLPELEGFINSWNFFEGSIHSRSYTHILRNIHANPTEIFDTMSDIKQINVAAKEIAQYYDNLMALNNQMPTTKRGRMEHKKALWLCLHAINALEGIRFYPSFACSWAFAENDLMMGNADIIRLIARDENLHLGFTQWLIKTLPTDDEDFELIRAETQDECMSILMTVMDQEKEWCDYLFSDGSIIGLNKDIMNNYIEFITAQRIKSIKMKPTFSVGHTNPLPWTMKWIHSNAVQAAPQEKEITDYFQGGINNDVRQNMFKSQFGDI